MEIGDIAARPPTGVSFGAKLAFEGVSHSFDGRSAILDDIWLTAEPGEVLCLLGPSGSGKTTLLRIAAGIETQSAGRLVLNGKEIAGPAIFVPPEKRSIGLVFQDFALFPHLSILENVRFGLNALSRAEGEREAMLALAGVGLAHHAKSFPHTLSGGEQQRVALARALAPRPAVLLMDEPFSGLDSRLKDAVRAETLEILRHSRATAIVVTHDSEEAMRLGDRIALIDRGKVVQSGPASSLFRGPVSLFAAGFFSELNVFRGRAHGGAVETPLGRFPLAGTQDGAAIDVAVRITGIEADEILGDIEARVLSRRFLGDAELLELGVAGAQMPVRARVRCGALTGSARDVRLTVCPGDVLLFEKRNETA